MTGKDKEEALIPNEQEKRLIALIREMGFGEMHITVRNGKPVRVEEIRKSVQLQ